MDDIIETKECDKIKAKLKKLRGSIIHIIIIFPDKSHMKFSSELKNIKRKDDGYLFIAENKFINMFISEDLDNMNEEDVYMNIENDDVFIASMSEYNLINKLKALKY